jgi:hypothetical protein
MAAVLVFMKSSARVVGFRVSPAPLEGSDAASHKLIDDPSRRSDDKADPAVYDLHRT